MDLTEYSNTQDIVFYGNKLFQSKIISVTLGAAPNLYSIYSYTLINAAVAICGYYFCAFTIDKVSAASAFV